MTFESCVVFALIAVTACCHAHENAAHATSVCCCCLLRFMPQKIFVIITQELQGLLMAAVLIFLHALFLLTWFSSPSLVVFHVYSKTFLKDEHNYAICIMEAAKVHCEIKAGKKGWNMNLALWKEVISLKKIFLKTFSLSWAFRTKKKLIRVSFEWKRFT